MRDAPSSAFLRKPIGVAPVWLSWPLHRHLIPAHALNAGDDANDPALGLKDRTLLDVKFEHGLELVRTHRLTAEIADALQFVAELDALAVLAAIGKVLGEYSCINAGTEHGGREARPFLVGPVDDHDGGIRFVSQIDHGAERFKGAQYTQHAVKLAAGWLGIEMRAHGDGEQIAAPARPCRKHVAD